MRPVNRVWAVLLAGALALCGCEMFGKDRKDRHEKSAREEKIEVSSLPANVREAFDKAHPGATIRKAEKEIYADGTVHYEIEFTGKNGAKGEVEIDSSGEVLPEH